MTVRGCIKNASITFVFADWFGSVQERPEKTDAAVTGR